MKKLLTKIFESILNAYISAYPDNSELRNFARKLDDYVLLAEMEGGRAVRTFVEDLRKVVNEDVYVDTAEVLSELRRVARSFEIKRREFASRLISTLSSDKTLKAGVEAHKIAANALAAGVESHDCPACSKNRRKSTMLRSGDYHFCPLCLAIYVERKGKLSFVHRLRDEDVELAVDLLTDRI